MWSGGRKYYLACPVNGVFATPAATMPIELRHTLPLALAALLCTAAQAQFTDDFSDGDFTNDPTWSGDVDLFTIVEEAGNNLLRSNSPGAATYHLSTPSTLASDAQWEFFLNLRFATSGANYVDMYLMSPQADLNPRPEGYFVRIGDTPDHIVLYKRVGTTNTPLVESAPGVVGSSSNNPFRIRVTRDLDNNWILAYQPGGTGPYTTAGTAVDNTFNSCTHFGILIVQSSAASPVNNHFFDDFAVGNIPVDETPPVILNVSVVNEQQVDVQFDEPVEQTSAENANNYNIIPFNSVAVAVRDALDPSRVRLTLDLPMQNGNTYTLTVNGVEDLAGNATVNAAADFLYFVPDVPAYRDVVINELMVDPNPPVGLPDSEYIELFNATTDKFFDLGGWRILAGSSTATLPSYALGPGQYVLFVNTNNHPQFSFVPNSLPFTLSTTALTNGGATVTLEAPSNVPIDQLTYSLAWYQDASKQNGGWSLEQINPLDPCSGQGNWRASNAPQGGTPGLANSVLDITPDPTPPTLQQVLLLDTTLLELVFNKGMDAASLIGGTWTISPFLPIAQITTLPPINQRVQLLLGEEMEEGVVYTITVTGVADCWGNVIAGTNSGQFAIPDAPEPGDVVINEVLHNPVTTNGEYVEVYNRSNKVLSLQGWQMANESSGAVANPRTIADVPLLFFPGEYLLFTRNPAVTASQFPLGRSERYWEVNLPSYTNTSGSVVVLDDQNTVIDLFRYDDKMHFTLLRDVKGVALERQDPMRPTDDRTNWHSAAENVGFGTPGYENSQFAPAPAPTGEMTIDPAIFSPDGDGFQDVLTIAYRFDQPGFVGTMRVFDLAGREVRRLMDSQLLGTTGAVSWDGVLDNGSKGRMGPYIIHFEAFDLDGNVESYRKTVTLAHRLN
jgi:hypothetical protein